ncbi:MAG: cache domain-containing protein [Deltaproteobacteria bacterium]|nr:cache domain-containing protein [Deltaproteobacteria bacterium]
MPGLIRNLNWLASFIACLSAVAFFAATASAGELSTFADKSGAAETGLIRLAAFTDDGSQSSKVDLQQLKKEMNHVFKVLNGILKDDSLTEEQKQEKAKAFIRDYRYGPEKKDYFWINDLQGKMIIYPGLPDLEGQNVSGFRDAEGMLVFVEMVKTSLGKGEGAINYLWAENEGEAPDPKTAFVRLLKAWGWVIGTGFYLETIEAYDMPVEPGDLPPIDDRDPASPV